jgi:hypothetical protein
MLLSGDLLVTLAHFKGSCADIITHRYVQSAPRHEDSTHTDDSGSKRPMIEHHKPWTVSCICLHRDKSSTNLDAEESTLPNYGVVHSQLD